MRNRTLPTQPARPGLSRDIRNVIIIWAIFTLILEIATLFIPSHLYGLDPIASDHANDYAITMMLFTFISMPVFAMVVVFAFYSVFRWRTSQQPVEDGPRMLAGRGIQIIWVAISVILVIGLYAWGLIFLDRADAAPPTGSDVLTVYVTGEQWNWNFTFPQYGNAQSDTLVVPLNRPIFFKITSIDVTHSFSVPAWGIKEDAVPGYFNYIRATPNRMGTYAFRCYELCGMFHSYMEGQVKVVSASDFATWVAQQPPGQPWGIGGSGNPNQYPEATPLPLNH